MHFTQNPIGSDDQLDLQDNAISFDYAMNSPAALWQDRFGKQHKTVQQALKDVGFKPAGFDFVSGGTLGIGDRDKCVFYPTDGYWYSWNGKLPYVVPANSSPTPGGKKGWGVVTRDERVLAREALRRTYQEVGLNLVDGSFEEGVVLVNVNDVLLQERTGKVFSGPAGPVVAGTNPSGGGFVDCSGALLRQKAAVYGTVAEIASGVYAVGLRVTVKDRDMAVFTITSGGTPDGYGVLAAGAGKTAVIVTGANTTIKSFGAKGDGVTDDTAAIQGAIDYAHTIGAEVIVPPSYGPYIYTEIANKGTLRGTGGTLKLKDGVCADTSAFYYTLHNFDGVSRTVMLPNCRYIDLTIDGNGRNNISFTVADALTAGGENVVVRGCRISDAPDSGIMFTFPVNGLCTENVIDGARDVGIYINDNESATSNVASITSQNIVRDCGSTGIALKRGMRGHEVTGNYVYNCGNGITHEYFGTGAGGWPQRCLISNNYLHTIGYPMRAANVVEVGISLGKFDNGVCTGNFIYDVSGHAISVDGDDFVVSNNIGVASSSANARLTALGNCGILVSNRTSFSASTGEVSDNSMSGFRDNALRVSSSGKLHVSGGYYRSTDTAFYVVKCTSMYVTGMSAVSTGGGFGCLLEANAQNVVMKAAVFDGDGGTGAPFSFAVGCTYTVENCVDLVRGIYDFRQSSGMPKSKNFGTATITGATGATITHGLRSGPNKFSLVPTSDSYWWVETVTSTQFTIRTTTSGNYTVRWTAEV